MESTLAEIKKIRARIRSTDNPALKIICRSDIEATFKKEITVAMQEQVGRIASEENLARMGQFFKINEGFTVLLNLLLITDNLENFIDPEDYLYYSATIGGQVALEKLDISGKFNIRDTRLIRQLKRAEDYLIDSVDQTTKNWLSEKIADGFSKRLSIREMAELINKQFKEISLSRAELIVSNEAANAAILAETRTFLENGVSDWHWNTNNDGKVTTGCLTNQAAGKRKIGEAFPEGPNPYHNPRFPGCRCWMEPDLDTKLPMSSYFG